jgi:hypothetical protein
MGDAVDDPAAIMSAPILTIAAPENPRIAGVGLVQHYRDVVIRKALCYRNPPA